MKRILMMIVCSLFLIAGTAAAADDLAALKQRGTLRHLGIPYANFVTGNDDGLCVALMQRFADYLGLEYQYVKTDWNNVFGDLLGKTVHADGGNVTFGRSCPVRGDIIANGLTILPWRQKVVEFSSPTFPTQVWLVAASNSGLRPIQPSGDINRDIAATKAILKGRTVMGKAGTCLDPSLYDLTAAGAETELYSGNLNEFAPAVINGHSETAILDVPDALVALAKWPGQILVIGPISLRQEMGVAFRPSDTRLRKAFNAFYESIRQDGTYQKLVKKYYPAVFGYFPDFFTR
ncbi:MAG: transporter substrate-binding domain-containing protein [Thermodesulfobacteriota bacterium]|nr:transporter substrate-binding domain-containing protein [Thermodesulfobacteriota bacterium]